MTTVDAGSLYAMLALWVGVAVALAVAVIYFARPRTRALYPGGPRRYLAAVAVQAAGFITPIPVVLVLLLGRPIFPGLDVVLAVAAGLAVVFALRLAPVTGALLKDLHDARVAAAMERLGSKR